MAEWETLANDPEVKPLLGVTYMRYAERQSEAAEVEGVERKLSDPVERKFLQNPGKLKQQNDRRKANLAAQSPPTDLRPSQRDKLMKLETVTRDFVADNMPTAEQMRHNPPGTVDHHIAWDRHAKRALLCWKNVRVLLNPTSDAVDLANFERYRPANAATRSLFTDGQIPGQFALSAQAKANYDAIDWSSPDVAARIQALIDSGQVKIHARGHRPRRGTTTGAATAITLSCAVEGCEVVYRGGFARKNLARHMAKLHGVREEVPA